MKLIKKVAIISILCTIILSFSNIPIYADTVDNENTIVYEYADEEIHVSLQAQKDDVHTQTATLLVNKDVDVKKQITSLSQIVEYTSYQLLLKDQDTPLQTQKKLNITVTLLHPILLKENQKMVVYLLDKDSITAINSTPAIDNNKVNSITFESNILPTFILAIEESSTTTKETSTHSLQQVPTVSTKNNLQLTLYDYKNNSYSQNILGDDTRTGARQGLVATTLEDNGFPIITGPGKGKGQSLSQLYDSSNTNISKTIETDYLFQRDSNGYYSYNSQNNYAYLNDNGNFEVYDRIAAPAGKNMGSFFPFNPLADDAKIMKTLSNGKNLYNLNSGTGAKSTNNGFGMKMDFDFIQPQDGKVNGQDMLFEFSGDDDVFVYIDGVLVLDIGGSHGPVTGTINFATGDVKINKVSLASKNYGNSTSLQKLFSGVTGKTFDDWSKHSLTFFYTERGGASNCKIKFNLPIVPKDSLSVIKEIDGMNDSIYSDLDFHFKLEVNGVIQDEIEYELYGENIPMGTIETTKNGIFTLKHGQMAIFKNLDIGQKYKIHEIQVDNNDFPSVSMNNTNVALQNGIATSPQYIIGTDKTVIVKNTVSLDMLSSLSISKQMEDSDNQEYNMQVKIGNSLYYGKYILDNKEYIAEAGVLKLKPGQQAIIKDIPAGTSFEIKEADLDLRIYENPIYTIDNANSISTDSFASGRIERNKKALITVTNKKGVGSITVHKTIVQNDNVHGDPIFTFKVSGSDGSVLYRTFRFTNNQTGTKTFVIDNLPTGITYTVTELKTVRYDLIDTIQTVNATADFKNHQAYTTLYRDANQATITFTNQKNYMYNFTHSDAIKNTFVVGKTIEKDNMIEEGGE